MSLETKGRFIGVSCAHLHQSTAPFPIARVARTCVALDETINELPGARHARRDDPREILPAFVQANESKMS
jgi:hypothetical protein